METIESVNFGAKFVKADLHIHSYGFDQGSYDVKDESMTPQNIVDAAISKDLKIISITDHNEILNSKVAIDYSENKDILVIPGIEVTTTQGHLLLYFPTYSDLRKFFGKINISDDKEKCSCGIIDCLNIAESYGGIGVLAHIELSSGFEQTIGRFGRDIEDILCHKGIYALEISKRDSDSLYTEKDTHNERKGLIRKRRTSLNLVEDYEFPKLMSSDSHTLKGLGKNADGENKLTRIKVDSLSFESFKIALLNHQSRIRLESLIPERIPKILDIEIEGGILDKQVVKFNDNLNCIIGGRGTGKSTLLEAIREVSGNSTSSTIVDCDVWPDKITLRYSDEAGHITTFVRNKMCQTVNLTDSENGISWVQLSSYGQGETADTIHHSDEKPEFLIDFLDSFINLDSLKNEDKRFCDELYKNKSQLLKLRNEVSRIPETKKQKADLENKIKLLEKDKVGDLVKLHGSLLREQELRKDLIDDLNNLVKTYKEILEDDTTFKKFEELSEDEIIVGRDNFIKIKEIVQQFHNVVSSKSGELYEDLKDKISLIKEQLNLWKSNEQKIQDDIEVKKKQLEEKGIPFNIGKITQINQDLIYFSKLYTELLSYKEELKKHENQRSELIKLRLANKDTIYKARKRFSDEVNNNLKNSVDGFFVSVKWKKGNYSEAFISSLKSTMGWRTSQVSKSKAISNNMSPLEFSSHIENNSLLDPLKNIHDNDGNLIFTDNDAISIQEKFTENNTYEELEALEYEDLPSIIVTKKIIDDAGRKKYLSKPITQLSLGQQQSILLAILIQSESNLPLIIDQPEDNLDSEFIFNTIVRNLRKIKETRQVIIVTHNANIGVLGDAELILPLKSTNIKSIILERGSIDRAETRQKCCEILEGGTQAFVSRKQIYGI